MSERADAEKLLSSVRSHFREKTLFEWGLVRREDDLVIGTCTLAHLDAANRRAELGFALGSNHWGNGYMGEALGALLAFSFDELSLHRLEADVDPRNDASIRLLEKLGFQREGHLRERWLVNGVVADTLFYGLLQREWQSTTEEGTSK